MSWYSLISQKFTNCAKLIVSELSLNSRKSRFQGYAVTIKKTTLPILLVLCIAMVPFQSLNAGNVGHMESMLVDSVECDMDKGVTQGTCDDAQCMMSAGYCGTQSITNIFSRPFRSPFQSHSLVGFRHSVTSRYRSHLDSSIYRPPIT